ncbi:hypothetical protein N8T08_006418 [Aspergillus melleus]|uniref:Uncharacterized protein n=1 Tax=Aspergillus melleus TaxID=138277 RepID=A0ACC3BEI6_9EURO|nr:hypothetical protein N8T08_006418 [Aspergillus melleus]
MTSNNQNSLSQSTPPPTTAPEAPFSLFDKKQKALIVLLVSTAATFSGFASNIYFPALSTIANDLNVSVELVNLTVTSYPIFQGLAPSLWGPISDSTGSASTIAIGSGVIGDITTRAERGGYMGIFQAGLLVPVAVGPVIGGALAGSLGWRYPLTAYQKLTSVQWKNEDESSQPPPRKEIDVTGPLRILISKHAAPIIIYLAIYYAVWQMSITAMSTLFKDRYGLSEIQIGLTFIANGVGSMIGTLVTGKILDADYRRVKQSFESSLGDIETETETLDPGVDREEDFPLEKARLRLIPIFSFLQCISTILFGWTIQYPDRVHIAVPIVSTFITGWTAVSTQSLIMTYLVDVFPDRSAAASASLNLARCLFAAGGTSFIMLMINNIGVGVAFTVCVVVQLVSLVGPLIQWRFAAGWRRQARP